MSLVLGYANKDNAIIISDGRAGIRGSFSENYNKTRKINDNIIIGFVGFVEPIEILLKYLFSQENRSSWFIDDFWKVIQFNLSEREEREFFNSSLIIIGRDRNKNMQTSVIGSCTDYKLLVEPVKDSPRYLCIGGSISESKRNQIINSNMSQFNSSIITRMKRAIINMAELDNTINANCFQTIL